MLVFLINESISQEKKLLSSPLSPLLHILPKKIKVEICISLEKRFLSLYFCWICWEKCLQYEFDMWAISSASIFSSSILHPNGPLASLLELLMGFLISRAWIITEYLPWISWVLKKSNSNMQKIQKVTTTKKIKMNVFNSDIGIENHRLERRKPTYESSFRSWNSFDRVVRFFNV